VNNSIQTPADALRHAISLRAESDRVFRSALRDVMLQRRWTQRELAERLDLTTVAVSKILNGHTRSLASTTVDSIRRLLEDL
jgi:transcriptional regulator with XRE-family HTH domain